MNRALNPHRNWPHDFPGWMYFGTLVHLVNVTLHQDAEPEDVVFVRTFEDRETAFDVPLLVSPEDDPHAERRAGGARAAVLEALRKGAITLAWLDARGTFHPVSPSAWRDGASDSDLTAILVRSELPNDLIPDNVECVANRSSLYVPVDTAAAVLRTHGGSRLMPSTPPRVLKSLGAQSTRPDALWTLTAAVIWAATRDLSVARGAHRYDEDASKRKFPTARAPALQDLARREISYYYCSCYRPVCACWDDALEDIVSCGKVGALVARGYKNDAGNQVDMPEGAWSGLVSFADGARLEPAKPCGDCWTHIVVPTARIMQVFPITARAALFATAPAEAVEASQTATITSSADRRRAELHLAAQLDRDGVAKRDVKATVIAGRWNPILGTPPKVSAITSAMTGGQRGRPSDK